MSGQGEFVLEDALKLEDNLRADGQFMFSQNGAQHIGT
jgi:hypothetical protein